MVLKNDLFSACFIISTWANADLAARLGHKPFDCFPTLANDQADFPFEDLERNRGALCELLALKNKQKRKKPKMLAQDDPVLDAFDRLRVREVRAEVNHTTATFLAQFQSIAASLQPDERIKLVYTHESMESLKAVLSDPQANKICSLQWRYDGSEDVNSVIALLANNCPELASLRVEFIKHSAFDFVSTVLEHPSNKVKVLEMPPDTEGDSARFFAALGQNQVSVLTFFNDDSPEFTQGLYEYLSKGLLVRLEVWMDHERVPLKMMKSLTKCTRLAELRLMGCKLSQPASFTYLPKSISKLQLFDCEFVRGFDWSFLANSSGMQRLDLDNAEGVDGNQFGNALAVRLREKGLDELRFRTCYFTNEILAAVGAAVGRIKKLHVETSNLNDVSIAQIALALQSPNSEMEELRLPHNNHTMSSIENHMVPALKHPNCNLAELSFCHNGGKARAKMMGNRFRNRLALFVLLEGRQVGRPLRRLPVEMFRLVGKVLI